MVQGADLPEPRPATVTLEILGLAWDSLVAHFQSEKDTKHLELMRQMLKNAIKQVNDKLYRVEWP